MTKEEVAEHPREEIIYLEVELLQIKPERKKTRVASDQNLLFECLKMAKLIIFTCVTIRVVYI